MLQGRAQKFEKGAAIFYLHLSTENIASSDVQFIPQNQVKTKKGQRVLTCPVSTVPLTADIYQPIFQRGEGGRDLSAPLDTPLC